MAYIITSFYFQPVCIFIFKVSFFCIRDVFRSCFIIQSPNLSFKKFLIYFQLCWVFVAAWTFFQLWRAGASLQLCCASFSLWWLLLLLSTGSRVCELQQLQREGSEVLVPRSQSTDSVVVAYRLSCSTASGIFPDQGSNPCLLHWQVDSFTTELPVKPYLCLLIGKFRPST